MFLRPGNTHEPTQQQPVPPAEPRRRRRRFQSDKFKRPVAGRQTSHNQEQDEKIQISNSYIPLQLLHSITGTSTHLAHEQQPLQEAKPWEFLLQHSSVPRQRQQVSALHEQLVTRLKKAQENRKNREEEEEEQAGIALITMKDWSIYTSCLTQLSDQIRVTCHDRANVLNDVVKRMESSVFRVLDHVKCLDERLHESQERLRCAEARHASIERQYEEIIAQEMDIQYDTLALEKPPVSSIVESKVEIEEQEEEDLDQPLQLSSLSLVQDHEDERLSNSDSSEGSESDHPKTHLLELEFAVCLIQRHYQMYRRRIKLNQVVQDLQGHLESLHANIQSQDRRSRVAKQLDALLTLQRMTRRYLRRKVEQAATLRATQEQASKWCPSRLVTRRKGSGKPRNFAKNFANNSANNSPNSPKRKREALAMKIRKRKQDIESLLSLVSPSIRPEAQPKLPFLSPTKSKLESVDPDVAFSILDPILRKLMANATTLHEQHERVQASRVAAKAIQAKKLLQSRISVLASSPKNERENRKKSPQNRNWNSIARHQRANSKESTDEDEEEAELRRWDFEGFSTSSGDEDDSHDDSDASSSSSHKHHDEEEGGRTSVVQMTTFLLDSSSSSSKSSLPKATRVRTSSVRRKDRLHKKQHPNESSSVVEEKLVIQFQQNPYFNTTTTPSTSSSPAPTTTGTGQGLVGKQPHRFNRQSSIQECDTTTNAAQDNNTNLSSVAIISSPAASLPKSTTSTRPHALVLDNPHSHHDGEGSKVEKTTKPSPTTSSSPPQRSVSVSLAKAPPSLTKASSATAKNNRKFRKVLLQVQSSGVSSPSSSSTIKSLSWLKQVIRDIYKLATIAYQEEFETLCSQWNWTKNQLALKYTTSGQEQDMEAWCVLLQQKNKSKKKKKVVPTFQLLTLDAYIRQYLIRQRGNIRPLIDQGLTDIVQNMVHYAPRDPDVQAFQTFCASSDASKDASEEHMNPFEFYLYCRQVFQYFLLPHQLEEVEAIQKDQGLALVNTIFLGGLVKEVDNNEARASTNPRLNFNEHSAYQMQELQELLTLKVGAGTSTIPFHFLTQLLYRYCLEHQIQLLQYEWSRSRFQRSVPETSSDDESTMTLSQFLHALSGNHQELNHRQLTQVFQNVTKQRGELFDRDDVMSFSVFYKTVRSVLANGLVPTTCLDDHAMMVLRGSSAQKTTHDDKDEEKEDDAFGHHHDKDSSSSILEAIGLKWSAKRPQLQQVVQNVVPDSENLNKINQLLHYQYLLEQALNSSSTKKLNDDDDEDDEEDEDDDAGERAYRAYRNILSIMMTIQRTKIEASVSNESSSDVKSSKSGPGPSKKASVSIEELGFLEQAWDAHVSTS